MNKLQEIIVRTAKNKTQVTNLIKDNHKEVRQKIVEIKEDKNLSGAGKEQKIAELKANLKNDLVAKIGEKLKENRELKTQLHDQALSKVADIYNAEIEDSPRSTLFNRQLQKLRFEAKVRKNKGDVLDGYKELIEKYGDDKAMLLKVQNELHEQADIFTAESDDLKALVRLNDSIDQQIRTDEQDENIALAFELVEGEGMNMIPDDITRHEGVSSDVSMLGELLDRETYVKAKNDKDYFIEEFDKLQEAEANEEGETEADGGEETGKEEGNPTLEEMMKTIGQEDDSENAEGDSADNSESVDIPAGDIV